MFSFCVKVIDRAVKVLDQMPPYDTHKIGVIFVGAGQVRIYLGYLVCFVNVFFLPPQHLFTINGQHVVFC